LLREAGLTLARQRVHVEKMAVLGSLSAQMAHDLKTPLTSIRGAAQFLAEERARGRSIDEQHEFLALFVREADRLVRLVDRYGRLGTLDPDRQRTDLNAIAQQVATSVRFGPHRERDLALTLDSSVPECAIDGDLVATALENLVSNAFDASAEGVRVELCTRRANDTGEVVVVVRDRGVGMDARHLERAIDPLFTTKAKGSGLGLPFARRVAEAHGGRLVLRSEVGRGTEVEVRLPIDDPEPGNPSTA
jgi:signal transduction histidine kinase